MNGNKGLYVNLYQALKNLEYLCHSEDNHSKLKAYKRVSKMLMNIAELGTFCAETRVREEAEAKEDECGSQNSN